MFEKFLAAYPVTDGDPVEPVDGPIDHVEWMALAGGRTFGGMYRVHTAASAALAQEYLREFFPGMRETTAFAVDWAGCHIVADPSEGTPGDPGIGIIDPAFGDAYTLPNTFSEVHDGLFVEDPDGTLRKADWDAWLARGGAAPRFDQCVGFEIPPALGGAEDVSNYELTDMEVYWSLTGQIRQATKHLAPGTPIGTVEFESDGPSSS